MSESADLDVVIVSHRDGRWLRACVTSLRERCGDVDLHVVVVENGGGEELHPEEVLDADDVEVVLTENRGFAAANNTGLTRCRAPHVLFLNPDTELVEGTLARLCAHLDGRPDVGVVAVRQVTGDGELYPTIRRFPTLARAVAQALGCERWPVIGTRVGERVLDGRVYERRTDCDWSTGAVLLVRRAALAAAGGFDERFFLFSEETDLCFRIKRAGWRVVHVPDVTFLHHADKAGIDPRREAQMAFARLQYAEKHFRPPYRIAYRAALVVEKSVRLAAVALRGGRRCRGAAALWAALEVLLGLAGSPFAASRDGGRSPARTRH